MISKIREEMAGELDVERKKRSALEKNTEKNTSALKKEVEVERKRTSMLEKNTSALKKEVEVERKRTSSLEKKVEEEREKSSELETEIEKMKVWAVWQLDISKSQETEIRILVKDIKDESNKRKVLANDVGELKENADRMAAWIVAGCRPQYSGEPLRRIQIRNLLDLVQRRLSLFVDDETLRSAGSTLC